MTTQSKLDTLKAMVRNWDRHRGIPDAWAICEFLVENLDIHHKIDADASNEAISKIEEEE